MLGVDASLEPEKLFAWIEENLLGRWTYRRLTPKEVHRLTGSNPTGGFFCLIGFEEDSDGQKFHLHVSQPVGQA
jgi:hypothetical protein